MKVFPLKMCLRAGIAPRLTTSWRNMGSSTSGVKLRGKEKTKRHTRIQSLTLVPSPTWHGTSLLSVGGISAEWPCWTLRRILASRWADSRAGRKWSRRRNEWAPPRGRRFHKTTRWQKPGAADLNGDLNRGHDQVGAVLRPGVDKFSTQHPHGLRQGRLAVIVQTRGTHCRLHMVHPATRQHAS